MAGTYLPWPPRGASLTFAFTYPCATLGLSGTLLATLTYEVYAGIPQFFKYMNVTNGCDGAVYMSDKVFDQPSRDILAYYPQYIT